jgi:nicotinate phosphoribosyltransferase
MTDLALRAHNKNWRLDPIVRSLLDDDFYKFMMGQFIFERYPLHQVQFGLKNRTKGINLGKLIDERELREQLDHVRTLRFTPQELIWLQGATFYGQERIFKPAYIDFLRRLKLPEYELSHKEDGDYVLTFLGNWQEVTYWEIPALTIVSELKTRAALRNLNKFELDVLYACAKTKLWNKLQMLKRAGIRGLSDMGTRRRHSFLWQEWAVGAARDVLGEGFIGTSNAYLAMKMGLEAIGTNAHELPMALTAIAVARGAKDDEIQQVQYDVLHQWQNTYQGNVLVALPDTFGTTQFLKEAPQWVSNWRGFRPDSKEPNAAAQELVDWWKRMGADPKKKLVLFSDGLDADNIVDLWNTWHDKVTVGFGWGTMLTNDFKGCHPRGETSLDPLSLVCKVTTADGHAAVKLSDNYTKATGPEAEVERYRKIFGSEGMKDAPVFV